MVGLMQSNLCNLPSFAMNIHIFHLYFMHLSHWRHAMSDRPLQVHLSSIFAKKMGISVTIQRLAEECYRMRQSEARRSTAASRQEVGNCYYQTLEPQVGSERSNQTARQAKQSQEERPRSSVPMVYIYTQYRYLLSHTLLLLPKCCIHSGPDRQLQTSQPA